MREIASLRSLERPRRGCGRFLAQIARIGIALVFIASSLGVHSALARAEVPGAPGITSCVLDIDHQHDDHPGSVSAIEHAVHLAGHLTGVVEPALLAVMTLDATRARHPIPADALPRSTTLPAPAEPPRA
ncbi:MAG: hypothetical protein WA208_03385 [Thermoanaerobaculia bacterium]